MTDQGFVWPLPALDGVTAPAFTTEQQCLDWLEVLPLTNATQAHEQLQHQLMLLNRFSVPAEERLNILEALRSPIHFVHGESIKRYAARSLPLAQLEQVSFDASLVLWQELATGYLHCLRVWRSAETAVQAACAAERALTAMLAIYIDHSRTAILPNAEYWRRLHSLYREAEAMGLALVPVEEKLRHAQPTTVSATYVEVLLLDAAHLHELRPKHIDLVAHWAKRWAGKVSILCQPPADLRTLPLCIDLEAGLPSSFSLAGEIATEPTCQRWLDMTQLRKHIKHHLLKLNEGAAVEDQTQDPLRERLLRQVYQDWCKGGRKQPASAQERTVCQLLTSFEAIHYFLSGKVFQPTGPSAYLNQRECNEIATLGGRRTTNIDNVQKMSQTGAHAYSIESWQVMHEDLRSILLLRAFDQPGGRLASGQLIALRTHATDSFQLGVMRWVVQDGTPKQLRCAVDLLPGVPVAATLLNTEAGGTLKELYCRGLCLPALPQLGESASLLMPTGWFRPGRIIEVQTDVLRKIRCTRLIERGNDFERGTFEVI